MAEYQITIARSAVKELEALPSTVIERVRERIRSLATDPRPSGSKKLHGRSGWRVRIGDYRVLYEIDDAAHEVDVGAIRHRSSAYD